MPSSIILSIFFIFTGLIGNQFSEIIIESLESKNVELKPVYNKIKFFPGMNQDIWRMDQSHFGKNPSKEKWERLYIIVDKTKSPNVASYYQLKSGSRNLNEKIDFRASCFTCHANGPRAIRANEAPLTIGENFQIQYWNLRIKSYGKIIPAIQNLNQQNLKTPFWFSSKRENESLKVKTCVKCHNGEGWPYRSKLHRQQVGTIDFLTKNNYMPPRGFHLSENEKKELKDFINGF